MCLRFGRRLASERISRSLRTDDPCSTAVHMEPFSSFSPQGSHLSICYYHKICTGGGSRRAHAGTFKRTPPRPSYSLRRKTPRGKCFRVFSCDGPKFHPSSNTNAPVFSFNHYLGFPKNQQNRTEVLFQFQPIVQGHVF
ncbi:hypothetical protein JTE90_016067 [Oedothorax gibbosus]|uniref:Uncharacterized protein n=1 Tax=Oedothorax gibbosus TaxID=931172 RepID=A0AAV6TG76_9ARAC|nr:hypothetical protein JTE90_016067 [Oedothorax gibbosus]